MNFKSLLFIGLLAALFSCKKEDTATPDTSFNVNNLNGYYDASFVSDSTITSKNPNVQKKAIDTIAVMLHFYKYSGVTELRFFETGSNYKLDTAKISQPTSKYAYENNISQITYIDGDINIISGYSSCYMANKWRVESFSSDYKTVTLTRVNYPKHFLNSVIFTRR